VHTFCIKEDFKPDTSTERVWDVGLGVFGWDYDHYSSSWFVDYCWTAVLTVYESYQPVDKVDTQAIEAYKNKIEAALKPYNIKIGTWNYQLDTPSDYGNDYNVDHADEFLPILDELLDNPELFVSACLCDESCFYTGNDDGGCYCDPEDIKKDGFKYYMKRN
jgi:hypothetical protein